jgi:uncharacterized membrane protein
MMYESGFNNMMGGGGWLGGLLLLFFGAMVLVGVVLLVMWMVKAQPGQGGPTPGSGHAAAPGHDEAVALARKRLAAGELTREQFDEIMQALGS